MSTTTPNLGLVKPAGSDTADIADINGNMDTLDTKIGAVGNTSLQAQVTALGESVSNKVDAGSGTNANIARMTSGTQLFGVYATAANNHRYALIVQSDKLTLYDFTAGGAVKTWA